MPFQPQTGARYRSAAIPAVFLAISHGSLKGRFVRENSLAVVNVSVNASNSKNNPIGNLEDVTMITSTCPRNSGAPAPADEKMREIDVANGIPPRSQP